MHPISAPIPDESLTETSDAVRAAGRQQPHTTEAVDREVWAAFERWCDATNRDALPTTEASLLAYLNEHPDWSWSYAKQITVVVNRVHVRNGHPKPAGAATNSKLRELARERGRIAEPLVDDFSADELLAMSRVLRGQPGGDGDAILRLSAAVIGCVLLGIQSPLDRTSLTAVWRGLDIRPRPGELVVSHDATRRLLREKDDPFVATVLRRAAALKSDEDIVDCGRKSGVPTLSCAWRRAGFGAAPERIPTDIGRDDLAWLITSIKPDAHRRLRDRAYILVGVFWALRHEDLAHLLIQNVQSDPDGNGYRAYFARSKADPEGSRPARLLPHVRQPDGSGRCDELCPACALHEHLRAVAAEGRTDGLLFATLYAGRRSAMTRQNARLLVRNAWLRTSPASNKRVATRSCRVTGATLAYQAGMPVDEIASKVTLHATIDEADRYIRRHNETEFQLNY